VPGAEPTDVALTRFSRYSAIAFQKSSQFGVDIRDRAPIFRPPRYTPGMPKIPVMVAAWFGLGIALSGVTPLPGQTPPSRRSERVRMAPVEVVSPDGRVRFTMPANAERLTFEVALEQTPVIEPSALVMTLDGYDLSAGVVLEGVEPYRGGETYPWYGAKSIATSEYRGLNVSLTHDLSSIAYTLEIRAFNDGVAFRHVIPGDATATRVPDEYSRFNLPAGSTVWYGGVAGGHYETPYEKKDIGDVAPGEWAGPPLTIELPQDGGYAAITEANLVDYSGMALEADGRGGWMMGLGHRHPLNYPFELRYGREEARRLGQPAAVAGAVTTPWRVVMIGRDLNTLVTSTIVPNLAPPPDPALFPDGIATSWIRPGRAVWRYLDGGPTGVEGMKTFSAQAGQLGFEHHVIEGFWRNWTPEQRRDVVEHARQDGVGLWFWQHSNQLRTPEAREAFFALLEEAGAAGAKIDFLDHEAKEVIDRYEDLLRDAARHRIMVVFHGSNKPTGRERTWPNELVRESVRGMESRSMTERARHQTILPFTRYLAGGADYTTMIFTERRHDSTVAHQIATMVVFASPLLTIAANPASLLEHPAVDVIKSIPSVWDETMVLPGSEIGEAAVFARRTGETWFVGAMCGPAARTVDVPLSFLGAGDYRSTFVRDDGDGSSVILEEGVHDRAGVLTLELRAGGGFVGRFSKPGSAGQVQP
jgi:alpha-glucosidase